MYFFSNSPVKWRLTKVVCIGHRRVNNGPSRDDNPDGDALQQKGDRTTPIEWIDQAGRGLGTEDETTGGGGGFATEGSKPTKKFDRDAKRQGAPNKQMIQLTFPVPPSPTRTSLKVGGVG